MNVKVPPEIEPVDATELVNAVALVIAATTEPEPTLVPVNDIPTAMPARDDAEV